ncbi:radical SAM protein [Desulfoplanes sp.]
MFLPFQGCPGRCTYCSQNLQTGKKGQRLDDSFDGLATVLAKRRADHLPPLGLGFFGGTFTAIPKEWVSRFLGLGNEYKQNGTISHIRCSTRPDAITPDMLNELAGQGLDMVELGIQSFDQHILDRANRQYDRETALAACTMVRKAGLELGLQMLPGLPGHTDQTWDGDIRECCRIRPEIVRLYPCLVLEGTVLAAWFRQGRYVPPDIEKTTAQLSRAVRQLWAGDIAVIRIGLTPEPLLVDNVLAGPWHPSLGNMVRSRALAAIIGEYAGRLGHPPVSLTVPSKYSGELWGFRRANVDRLQQLGITKETVRYTDGMQFTLD